MNNVSPGGNSLRAGVWWSTGRTSPDNSVPEFVSPQQFTENRGTNVGSEINAHVTQMGTETVGFHPVGGTGGTPGGTPPVAAAPFSAPNGMRMSNWKNNLCGWWEQVAVGQRHHLYCTVRPVVNRGNGSNVWLTRTRVHRVRVEHQIQRGIEATRYGNAHHATPGRQRARNKLDPFGR